MFVTENQIFVFIACIAFGGVSGIIFSLLQPVKILFKIKSVAVALDIISFLIVWALFVQYSLMMEFPSIRAYMPIGVFIGLTLYFKSFKIILAKYIQKLYNRCRIIFVKVRNDRRKNKKIDSRRDGRRGASRRHTSRRDDLSVNINRR